MTHEAHPPMPTATVTAGGIFDGCFWPDCVTIHVHTEQVGADGKTYKTSENIVVQGLSFTGSRGPLQICAQDPADVQA